MKVFALAFVPIIVRIPAWVRVAMRGCMWICADPAVRAGALEEDMLPASPRVRHGNGRCGLLSLRLHVRSGVCLRVRPHSCVSMRVDLCKSAWTLQSVLGPSRRTGFVRPHESAMVKDIAGSCCLLLRWRKYLYLRVHVYL